MIANNNNKKKKKEEQKRKEVPGAGLISKENNKSIIEEIMGFQFLLVWDQ